MNGLDLLISAIGLIALTVIVSLWEWHIRDRRRRHARLQKRGLA